MVLYPNDYKIGTDEEANLLPCIRSFFNKDIKRSVNPTAKHDYSDGVNNYELKSRKNCYNQYPTTYIQADKLVGDEPLYLIFNFTDGVYYILYNEEKFKNYSRSVVSRLGYDKIHNVDIPIGDLTFICERENAYSKQVGCCLIKHLVKK